MKKSVRKGFTLVELLIVIVVIGILSAMMMLSSTEAVSSARAADIVSDLRNLKTAALAFYADNLDLVEKAGFTLSLDGVVKYLGTTSVDSSKYGVDTAGSVWFVKATVSDTNVRGKLKGRASSVGLLKTKQSGDITASDYYDGSTGEVFYKVR